MRENIYDNRNQLIGFLIETSNQIQIFDKTSRLKGWYNKNDGNTYKNGSYFGKGDQTMRLLD
jgi:hypothetical protein